MIIVTFIIIYMSGRHYRYYSLVMDAFISLGMICFYKIFIYDSKLQINAVLNSSAFVIITALISIAVSFYLTPNRYLYGVAKNELPQYQFAEIINEKENSTLLNYRFLDGGFYTAANIIPNCKAFCKLNTELQEMYDLQEYYIQNGLCDFVVTKEKFSLEKYELIKEATFPYNDTTQTFYLYKLK